MTNHSSSPVLFHHTYIIFIQYKILIHHKVCFLINNKIKKNSCKCDGGYTTTNTYQAIQFESIVEESWFTISGGLNI